MTRSQWQQAHLEGDLVEQDPQEGPDTPRPDWAAGTEKSFVSFLAPQCPQAGLPESAPTPTRISETFLHLPH